MSLDFNPQKDTVIPNPKTEKQQRKINFGLTIDRTNTVSGYLELKIPSLFNTNNNCNISYSTNNNINVSLIRKTKNASLEVNTFRKFIKIPAHNYEIRGIDFKFNENKIHIESIEGTKSLKLEFLRKIDAITIASVIGVNDKIKPFIKSSASLKIETFFSKNIFQSSSLNLGVIFGDPHISDRIFLGANTSGYKAMSIFPTDPLGGKSFIEVSQKIGMKIKEIEVFAFADLGFNSMQSNLLETFKSAVIASTFNIQTKCLGMSIGLGIKTPVLASGKKLKATVAIPLTKNEDTQKLQVGFEADL